MAYNKAIPQLTDKLSNSQADLLANFDAIQDFIEVNHVTFADSDFGKHTVASFPTQSGAPAAVADQVDLYNIDVDGTSELCIQRSDGTSNPITSFLGASEGWTYLPSGLILKWGYEAATTSGAGTYTFPVSGTIPVFSHIYHVTINPFGDGGLGSYDYVPYITAFSVTGMSVYGSARTVNTARANCHFRYLAIGD